MAEKSGARWVALGIVFSRLSGLARQAVLARFLGVTPFGDVWTTALRAPNAIQNLLGEQALSASFIPIYSRLLEEERHRDASRFAGAIFALLAATVTILVALGVLFAEPIVRLLGAGFVGDAAQVAAGQAEVDRLPPAVAATRIIFPMTGMLVLGAWALGILNSHRRFFLPYFAPVMWNAAIVSALLGAAATTGDLAHPAAAPLEDQQRWLFAALWGALVGGLLQVAVQLPTVWKLLGGLRPKLSLEVPGVREALRTFGPAVAGRGVVQVSFYISLLLATFLSQGSVSAILYASTLYALPLSVFGVSVAAAELPELSRAGGRAAAREIGGRIDRALRQSVFLIAPSIIGYLAFGYLVVSLIYRGGQFGEAAGWLVYTVLAGLTCGLLATTLSRLLQNTFFALGDTRTPARIAALRIAFGVAVATGLMLWLDSYRVGEVLGLEVAGTASRLSFGALGLGLADGLTAWIETLFLLRALRHRLPDLRLPARALAAYFGRAILAALPASGLWFLLPPWPTAVQALLVLPLYAGVYLAHARLRRAPELALWLGRER